MHDSPFIERLWERGQEHLGAMRYTAAVRCLDAAEAAAWCAADPVALARIYLPLLEARRQIRYQAAEGVIVICGPGISEHQQHAIVREFLQDQRVCAGTLLLHTDHKRISKTLQHVEKVREVARRESRWLEALVLITHGKETRMASPGDAMFAGGLPVKWTKSADERVGDSSSLDLQVPLPGAGRFEPGDAYHALARESVIVGWEGLTLKWQHRHPPQRNGGVWQEMAWLRKALQIDPACEPVAMRMMALGEAAGRGAR